MDRKDAAHQRKNHVLSDSARRLKNLVEGEDDVEDDLEVVGQAADKLNKMKEQLKKSATQSKGEKTTPDQPEEEPVVEGEASTVRFFGYLQLHLYFLAFVVGAFVSYTRHKPFSLEHSLPFVRNMFQSMEKREVYQWYQRGFSLWDKLPTELKNKYVKYMGYGTIFLSLYPALTAPSPKRPDPEHPNQAPLPRPQSKVNKLLVKLGSSVARVSCATLLFGLLGYDLVYNYPLLKSLFKKA